MLFHNAYVRGTCVGPVSDTEVAALAEVLVAQPVEVILSAQGGGHQLPNRPGRQAAAALARRNVRAILARNRSADEVTAALKVALTASPRDAEDALEDASLDFNVRYSIFATCDATLRLENRCLVISDGREAVVRIPRQDLRQVGTTFFCKEALSRLVTMEIAEVHLAPSAITPLSRQLEPGAVMEPDTAHEHLHKGAWRSVRKADFVKDYCVACGRCFIHCPDNAIIHAMFDTNARDTTGILGIDTDRCTACGLCAAVCPTNRDGYKAIVMIEAEAEGTPDLHCVG